MQGMTVALYARVSTRDHEQNPETQLLPLREWAARQSLVATEYVDHASGGNLNRPGWQAMMAEVRKGRLSVVAVVRLDRAFRSVPDMHATLAEFDGRGVRFAAITQPIDTGTPVGRLLITVLGAVAEFERDLTIERVHEGLARARRDGHRLGRPPLRRRISELTDLINGGLSVRDAAAQLGVSHQTAYGWLSRKPRAVGESDDA